MMNFDLEEQLVRSDVTSGEAEARQRALTIAEFSLSEKEKVPSLSLSFSPLLKHAARFNLRHVCTSWTAYLKLLIVT